MRSAGSDTLTAKFFHKHLRNNHKAGVLCALHYDFLNLIDFFGFDFSDFFGFGDGFGFDFDFGDDFGDGFGDGVEYRDAVFDLPAASGDHPADHLRAVLDHQVGMDGRHPC